MDNLCEVGGCALKKCPLKSMSFRINFMAELIRSISGIFQNRDSGYKPFNANQFGVSIEAAAVQATIRLINQAAIEVIGIEQKKQK